MSDDPYSHMETVWPPPPEGPRPARRSVGDVSRSILAEMRAQGSMDAEGGVVGVEVGAVAISKGVDDADEPVFDLEVEELAEDVVLARVSWRGGDPDISLAETTSAISLKEAAHFGSIVIIAAQLGEAWKASGDPDWKPGPSDLTGGLTLK